MASSAVPLYDNYLNKYRLERSQLNSINNNNNAHNKVENVAYYLEKAAEKPRFETNVNNFNFSGGDDRWSTAGTSSVFSPVQVQPFTMSSVQLAQPQQQYSYNQQQGQSSKRQSIPLSTTVITPQQHQQQQCPKSYPFQQSNYPSNNILFNNAALSSLSSSQPPNQNQREYSQWLYQFEPDQQQGTRQTAEPKPIERPTEIRFIGWVDILSAVLCTVLAVHNIFTKPITDPDNYIWLFFIGFIDILIKLMMGFGLLTGLRSDDDFSTLWYCKLWIVCQVLFLFCSVISVMTHVLLYASKSTMLTNEELPVAVPLNLGIFFYRILCFILVRKFVGKLKKSEAVILAEADTTGYYSEHQQRRQTDGEAEQENRNKFGTGDSAFCGPSAALILSL